MTATCSSGARPAFAPASRHNRVRRLATRCSASPFGDAKGKGTASSASSPFGSGSGGGTPFAPVAANPFEKATNPNRKRPERSVEVKDPSEAYRAWDDVQVFDVPLELRRPGKDGVDEHVKFYGLEELFPGTSLQRIFNASEEFRTGIRRAMRDDLFVEDPKMSEKANAAIRSLNSSLMVNWKTSRTGYAAFTKLFEEHGIMNLTGEEFIQTLGSLCGAESHGSLIDITGTGRRKERHSWHQDSGLERFTVMLGFPPESGWEGVGVFSHSCKLSHPLRQDGDEGTIIQWEDFDMGDLPWEVIGRPEYREGHEVMVYCDATHIHSAPDETNRESVWRFM